MTHYCGNPLLVFVRSYGLDLHCTRCGRSWAQTWQLDVSEVMPL